MEKEELPALINNEQVDSDLDDDDFDEEMLGDEPATCLFCDKLMPNVDAALTHLDTTHKVNFAQLKLRFQMDQYSFIKLINCIRCESISAERLANAQTIFWHDEKYLKPKDYEPWLSYDYDELPVVILQNCATATQEQNLQALVLNLRQKVQEQAQLLEQANEDMSKMRLGFQRMLEKDTSSSTAADSSNKLITLQADIGYFSSYAHFGIHHEMLSDVVRTTSYRDALLKNSDFVRGKDVLDVGCGTAVLSIFASQAGAKNVVGIDNSDIIYNAMDIVKKNKIPNINLIKGRLEQTALPQQEFDIIISEWMGYFLLFEGMLDSVIYARDKHLKPGGVLLPNRCTISLIGYGCEQLYKQHVTFWDDVYGLDMSNMRKEVLHEPLIDIVDAAHILTASNTILDLNLCTVDLNYSNFTFDFNLKCQKAGRLSAFVGYFDTYFELPQAVHFGTAPTDKPTHWKQVVFFIAQPQAVQPGDVVNGNFVCNRSRNNARSLDVHIEVFGERYTYYLD